MKQIWKFKLDIDVDQIIEMPIGAIVLKTKASREDISIWAIVDIEAELEKRKFSVFGTGDNISDEHINTQYIYIDSCIFEDNSNPLAYITHISFYVWHVFEVVTLIDSPKQEIL